MKQIGILIEKSRAYGRSLIEGVADFAQGQGDWTLRPLPSEDMSVARFGEYDGIIARIADRALAERLVRSGVPTVDVFCQQSYPGLAGVDSDHRRIGEMARDFFRSRGFVHLAFCGLPGIAFSDARQAAFADESTHVYAHAPILPTADSQFFNERLDRIPDARMLKRWLVALPKPVAVFCCNDLRAIQLQRVAVENGLRVPQDVAILGADNDTIACSFADVPISSIDPNAFEIGKSAARILATMLRRKPERKLHRVHSVRPGAITERTSTEFMPIDPPWLGKVLMHIEKNIGRPTTASEIFALTGRSSTHVENVFKAKLGLSVQAYITSVKMRAALRHLDDPDLRISEIAYLCGYDSPAYFCRTFCRTFGKSPRALRATRDTHA